MEYKSSLQEQLNGLKSIQQFKYASNTTDYRQGFIAGQIHILEKMLLGQTSKVWITREEEQ